jgi:hypothetical protein
MFDRPQDFKEFQICDFEPKQGGMEVWVRRAKNDKKGKTRSAFLECAVSGEPCPVGRFWDYAKVARIERHPECNKVLGEPERCTVCPPAFPTLGKRKRVAPKQGFGMPVARVTETIRALYVQLASTGKVTLEQARQFSGKSMRCGGVSAAAGLAIRDGVLQGHGGWLSRASLIHYDGMTPGEIPEVSRALNAEVARWLEEDEE